MIEQFGEMVSCEETMLSIFELMRKVSPSDASILILGESGTGKELMARAIHENSSRKNGELVIVNCAAIPENLIESELFGHKKGSFTGATTSRIGKFEAANGGTLFLDEIGDMAINTQAKILRALEDRTIEPIGENKRVSVDVRIIAATNRHLMDEVKEGNFRNDLFFRLNEITVTLPPLRDRRGDMHLLLQQMMDAYNEEFKKEVKGISVPALGVLQNHTWPGNIRELRNIIKRAVLVSDHDTIWIEHLPVYLNTLDVNTLFDPQNILPLSEVEKMYISQVLMHTRGNKSKAAKLLKIDRSTLYEKISRYEISV
jgi:two-component system response regulator HydG